MNYYLTIQLALYCFVASWCSTTQSVAAGDKWQIVYQSDSRPVFSCFSGSKDGRLLVAAGQIVDSLGSGLFRFYAVMSSDSGKSWKRISGIVDSVTGPGLTAKFIDASVSNDGRNALIVGGQGVVIQTTDFGLHWTKVTSIPAELYQSVSMASDDPNVLFTVGSYHFCELSVDAGRTWADVRPPDSGTVRKVCCINSNTLIALGIGKAEPRDKIYISYNRGVTWDTVLNVFKRNPNTPNATVWTYTNVVYDNHDTLVIAGLAGDQIGTRFLSTTDGGHSWHSDFLSGDTCYAGYVTCKSFSTRLCVGFDLERNKALWYETTDAGKSFSRISFPQELGTQTSLATGWYRFYGDCYYMMYYIPQRFILYKRSKSTPPQLEQPQYVSPLKSSSVPDTVLFSWTTVEHATAYEFWLAGLPSDTPDATTYDTLYFEKHQITRDTVVGNSRTFITQRAWSYIARIRAIDNTGNYLSGDWNEFRFAPLQKISPVEVFIPIGKFLCYPNPSSEVATVNFFARQEVQSKLSLRLYDNLGGLLADYTSTIELDPINLNCIAHLPLSDLPSGVHLLVLSDGVFTLCQGFCIVR